MKTAPTVRALEPRSDVFSRTESRVRSYSRSFPALFTRAEGATIWDDHGRPYLDFLAGAGSLNYGHNHPVLREALLAYIHQRGIAHSLDLHTSAKADFLIRLERFVLAPRRLPYVAQFTGPTGTNAVEAALKLARKRTGRYSIVSFTNGFHGVTLGALAMTGNSHHRGAAGIPLPGAMRMPYDGYLGPDVDTLDYFEKTLTDGSSGVDLPAAVIVETVQGEGGLNVASAGWLRRLEAMCRRHGILLICDDIQAGCGRMGSFFSFEEAGLAPDMVTLSKSLSGMGLPFALVLIRRDLDCWAPGEHNGTFRGNDHAFVTAAAALEHFWSGPAFAADVRRKAALFAAGLAEIAAAHPGQLAVKGREMMQGLAFTDAPAAAAVSRAAFSRGLMVETSGPRNEVVKCLCPLVIEDAQLARGLEILGESVREVIGAQRERRVAGAQE